MTTDLSSSRSGEYVLGTLTEAERHAFEIELANDSQLQAEVADWERRLAPLAKMIAPQEPSPAVWAAIERKLDVEQRTPSVDAQGSNVVYLRRSVRIWRSLTAASGALAAALALFILADRWQGHEASQDYVAVVNRGGTLPALIVRVDTREGTVKIRSLSAEAPPDKSLELWYIGAGQTPKSLGTVENASHPIAIPAALRTDGAEGASIAVTLEPKGGSPTGVATGPIVYSGKLIKEQP
jgi:anti-sigma-K factor RskA